jgi:ATP-dependent DNA helicase RecG
MNFPSYQEVLEICKNGEDSTIEFKEKYTKELISELIAFANTKGGFVFIGINDDGEIVGIKQNEIKELKNTISNISNETTPALSPDFKLYTINEKHILVILIEQGDEKPYFTTKSECWIRRGESKRRAKPNELRRFFSNTRRISEDERLTRAKIDNALNESKFRIFFDNHKLRNDDQQDMPTPQLIENFNLGKNGNLSIGGLLLFGKQIQDYMPNALIKIVSFYGNNIEDNEYIEKIEAKGSLDEQFEIAMSFLKRNLKRIKSEDGFNANSKLEISLIAIEEAIVNALFHRDYTYESAINIFLFQDRLEIISPGALPNHLDIIKIKNGISIARNPILVSFGQYLLPYSGIGSGVKRILKEHKKVEFKNDENNNRFITIFYR